MKLFFATTNYVVKGTVKEFIKQKLPQVQTFDVLKDEDFKYHLGSDSDCVILVEKFFLGLCIQEKMTSLKGINDKLRFVFFETGDNCSDFFGLRVHKLGATGFISNAEVRDELCPKLERVFAGCSVYPETVTDDIKKGMHLTRAVGELTDTEFDVAVALAKGKTVKEIAYEMGVTDSSVRTYIHYLRLKIGYQNPADYAEVYRQMLDRNMGGWNGSQD